MKNIDKVLSEFQRKNEKIGCLDRCLCVTEGGDVKILPIVRDNIFLDGEFEVKAVWFCDAMSAVELIGGLFSEKQQ